jgi:uncharacterized cupin superfamily protein
MSDTSPSAGVVSLNELDPQEHEHGIRSFRLYRLSHAAGGVDIGASLYELDAGTRSFPAHYHVANEEALYVLEGRLTLWTGSGDDPIRREVTAGEYVAFPTGPAFAHDLEAVEDARFLFLSTMVEPDFTVFPEDRKVTLVAGDAPGEFDDLYVSKTLDFDAELPFWDDEESGGDGHAAERVPEELRRVAADDLDWTEYDHGDHRFRRKQLGAAAGSEDLGASRYEVPPGKRTWLAHYHTGNEEAVYVLDGSGTMTLGIDREEHTIGAGDYVALPAGERGYHDVVAGEAGLSLLMVSTMNEPDITVYPDDGKVGLYAGSAPGGEKDERTLSTYLDADAEVEYWE